MRPPHEIETTVSFETNDVMTPSTPPVRVAVIADDPLARAGLAALVTDPARVEVIAYGSSPVPDPAARADSPDVLVVDGESERDLFGSDETPRVALVRGEPEARAALASGARAVVRREADGPLLRAAVHAVQAGLVAIDPGLGEFWSSERERSTASARGIEALTPRESEVLPLLAEGLANKEIAARLGISEHTVKFHVNAVMAKLGVQSRTEAVVRAARRGWLLL